MSRPYRLGRREDPARKTRETILQTTARLLTEAGMQGVTIEAVAREAGVSRVTVYDHFQHKAGLLEALAWWTFAQHDIDRIRQARLQDDVRLALSDFVRENARFFHSLAAEGRAVLKTVTTDPDAATVVKATYIDARRAAIRELVDRLHRADELAPAWPPERAVEALMITTSLEAFQTLTEHSRLRPSEADDILAELASVVLRG
jgi:AcrR family transcriptional regulator